ncbi:hypothetical protein SLEP1_g53258 [Rubroshorea leprosula]|uniref:Transmembrane protein n=1 Tax=Rubroshorea leprosula TaxID=152421 RepID=A0AAV5M910_9ROSI|nr:hypothetical protein SLEP1_g53258 [Rubroshorea leprosula]
MLRLCFVVAAKASPLADQLLLQCCSFILLGFAALTLFFFGAWLSLPEGTWMRKREPPGVPSLCSFISFHLLPLVQLHVAVLAATLQPHLHFITTSFHQHLQHSLLHFAATVLWCNLPSSFAASCAAFLPFAASCAALTPQLQQLASLRGVSSVADIGSTTPD